MFDVRLHVTQISNRFVRSTKPYQGLRRPLSKNSDRKKLIPTDFYIFLLKIASEFWLFTFRELEFQPKNKSELGSIPDPGCAWLFALYAYACMHVCRHACVNVFDNFFFFVKMNKQTPLCCAADGDYAVAFPRTIGRVPYDLQRQHAVSLHSSRIGTSLAPGNIGESAGNSSHLLPGNHPPDQIKIN